jgi:hypothetical protein
MSNDGNKICLDATPGNENIEVCDQYGNQVVLHASACRITIESPTMKSKIQVGNTDKGGAGIYGTTEGDIYLEAKRDMILKSLNQYNKRIEGLYKTWVGGSYRTNVNGLYAVKVDKEYYSHVNGAKYDFVWGGKIDVCAPSKTVACIGLKIDVCAGAKVVVEEGVKVKVGKMAEYKFNNSRFEEVEDKYEVLAKEIRSLALDVRIQADQLLAMNAPKINMCNGSLTVK